MYIILNVNHQYFVSSPLGPALLSSYAAHTIDRLTAIPADSVCIIYYYYYYIYQKRVLEEEEEIRQVGRVGARWRVK